MPHIQESGVDRRAARTRTAIIQCFRQMICEMDCTKITVKELAQRIDINRKTFYLHFPSIEDLFDYELDSIVAGYMEKMLQLPLPIDMDEQTKVFFQYYCTQPSYVERLMCHPSYRYYCTQLHEKALAKNQKRYNRHQGDPSEEQHIITTFLVSACMGLYRQWIQDGKLLTIERLTELACQLISYGYKGLELKCSTNSNKTLCQ